MAGSESTSLAQLAQEGYRSFIVTSHPRPDVDEPFTTLADDAPDWVSDLVRSAHGEFLPDDWRYASIRSALGFIADNDLDDPDRLDESGSEFADGNVDTYSGARFAWLASNLQRAGYCDNAVEEGLISADSGIAALIGAGQYEESLEVWHSVVESLREVFEEQQS